MLSLSRCHMSLPRHHQALANQHSMVWVLWCLGQLFHRGWKCLIVETNLLWVDMSIPSIYTTLFLVNNWDHTIELIFTLTILRIVLGAHCLTIYKIQHQRSMLLVTILYMIKDNVHCIAIYLTKCVLSLKWAHHQNLPSRNTFNCFQMMMPL